MKRVGQSWCNGLLLLSFDVATMDIGGQVVGSKLSLLPILVNVFVPVMIAFDELFSKCTPETFDLEWFTLFAPISLSPFWIVLISMCLIVSVSFWCSVKYKSLMLLSLNRHHCMARKMAIMMIFAMTSCLISLRLTIFQCLWHWRTQLLTVSLVDNLLWD